MPPSPTPVLHQSELKYIILFPPSAVLVRRFKGCSYSPPHKRILCEKEKSFCCSSYLVVILPKLLAARTEAPLSYFLLLSGGTPAAGEDAQHVIRRLSPGERLVYSLFTFLLRPPLTAHLPRRRDATDLWWRLLFGSLYQRERSYLDLYSIQYWYNRASFDIYIRVFVISTVVIWFHRIRYLLC